MSRTAFAALVSLALFVSQANALVIAPGGSESLTIPQEPSGGATPPGTVIASKTVAVDMETTVESEPLVFAFGNLQSQVIQDPATKDLTFFYSFFPENKTPQPSPPVYDINMIQAGSFSTLTTDVTSTYQSDASIPPMNPPALIGLLTRAADGSEITLTLSNDPFTDLQTFSTLAIATNATAFRDGSLGLTASQPSFGSLSQSFDSYAPVIPLPRAVYMGLIGLGMMVLARFVTLKRTAQNS